MNLELLDPFEQDFPEVIEDTLEDGPAVIVKFNRRGTLLAAGCSDGRIVVWDFDTRGVARSLVGHVKTVTSLSWSRNGRLLLSSSLDWSCIVWDLLTGTKLHTIRFDTAVFNAQFHPKINNVFIAVLHQEKPVLVDFKDGIKRYPIPPDKDDGDDQNDEQQENDEAVATPPPSSSLTSTASAANTQIGWTLVARFDHYGKRIYTGTNRGMMRVYDAESRELLYEFRVTTSAIKHIQFSRRGKEFVVNSNDRIIRLFGIKMDNDQSSGAGQHQPPELLHKFQDLVNRNQWNQCCLSSDADYVIGGSGHQAEHNIYIWDKLGGNLVKILEGPKEPLEDLAWHPVRPIVASVSSYGTIHIWATNYQENWSAFAPDFKELEENVDYEEREDEFDIVPEEEATKRKHVDEDIEVDVTTIDKINPFNDSDTEDGEEETFYLPLLPSDHVDEELLHGHHHHHCHNPHCHRHFSTSHNHEQKHRHRTSRTQNSAQPASDSRKSSHQHRSKKERSKLTGGSGASSTVAMAATSSTSSIPSTNATVRTKKESDTAMAIDDGNENVKNNDKEEDEENNLRKSNMSSSTHSSSSSTALLAGGKETGAANADSPASSSSHRGRDRDRDRDRDHREREHRDRDREHDRERGDRDKDRSNRELKDPDYSRERD
ncbi:hypothetical protein BGW42_003096, partial [Actinomortierella wolfii]